MKPLALPCSVEGCTNRSIPGHPDKICRECFVEQRQAARDARERRASSFREALACATPGCKNSARLGEPFCTVCLAMAKQAAARREQEQRERVELELLELLTAPSPPAAPPPPMAERAGARAAAESLLQSMPAPPTTVLATPPVVKQPAPPPPPTTVLATPPVVKQPAPPPPPPEQSWPAPPVPEDPVMTEHLDSAPRRTHDNPITTNMTTSRTPDFVPQDLYNRFRKLRREMDRVPAPNGRKQWPTDMRVEVIRLAAEAAAMEPPISNTRAAELLGIHQSLISQWGKIHKMATGSTRPASTRRTSTKAKPTAAKPTTATAAPPAKASAPATAKPGSELERLRLFVDDVDAFIRLHSRGRLDAAATIAAIVAALNDVAE